MEGTPTPAQRWFRRVVKLILLVASVIVTIWLWPKDVVEVRTVAVKKGRVEAVVPSVQAGIVKSHRQANLRSVAAGRAVSVAVTRGDRVEQDQLLIELDGASLMARLRLAKANLLVGQSALRSAQVRLDAAESALARNKKLAAKGVMAAGALERFQAEYDVAKETISSAEANLAQLKAGVDVARAAYDETRIKAPFAGLVTQVHVELGEVVSPAAPLLDLVDDTAITIEAPVDEADVAMLKKGMPVRVQTDAYRDRAFQGQLVYISPVVLKDLRQNSRLNVEVSLNGAGTALKVGMSADIEVIVAEREDTLWVPTSAIMRRGDGNEVYVVSAGQARRRSIRTGLANWDRTEVIEGLHEGERVVVSLEVDGLGDGAQVRLQGVGAGGKAVY